MSTPIAEAPADALRRRPWLRPAVALAAAVALVAGAWGVLAQGESEPPLELALPPQDGPLASCLPVTAERLRDIPLAFEGTVVSWSEHVVILDVDTWYRGGETDQVELRTLDEAPRAGEPGTEGPMVSLVDFQVGEAYLITATDGMVNYCGYSAAATPELRAIFEEAYLP